MALETTNRSFKVLMLPHLAVGHITPFLELARKLSHRGFSVHLCSTPINLTFIKDRYYSPHHNDYHLVHLLQLHLPESPQLPPHYHTTNGLPPHLIPDLLHALTMAKPAFSAIMKSITPDLLIYDAMVKWAPGVAAEQNVPAARFVTASSAVYSYFYHLYSRPDTAFPYPAILPPKANHERFVQMIEQGKKVKHKDEDPFQVDRNLMLFCTSREMEGKYLDYIGEMAAREILPLGTLTKNQLDGGDDGSELLQWLGTKEERSSVFVSFGSECYLEKEEMEELGLGLEQSKVNFIWVVRFPKGDEEEGRRNNNLEAVMPEGFLERVGERGRVVEGWAPQAKILAHPSIGGFVSHCGWNSIMESIEFGVPIIAMPKLHDQLMNAKVMVDIKVAIEVVRDEKGKLHREEVRKVVEEVVGGEEMRNNVRKMGEKVKVASVQEMDESAKVLAHLCAKN